MPELPEVDAVAVFLDERLRGSLIARLDLTSIAALKTFDPPLSDLEGRQVVRVWRRGKYLVLDTDGPHLVLHLARAGWLQWRESVPTGTPRPGKGPLLLRATFASPDGELLGAFDVTEAGTRKSAAVWVVRDVMDVPRVATLGPEPLDPSFTPDVLAEILAAAGGAPNKGVLRDQSRIAGIGNAYSDEVLHVAHVSPYAPAKSFDDDAVVHLHDVIVATLSDAVKRSSGQQPALLKGEKRAGMRVHGRTGQQCPECGDIVREVSFADSSLQYCATCQTGGKPLADRRMSKLLK